MMRKGLAAALRWDRDASGSNCWPGGSGLNAFRPEPYRRNDTNPITGGHFIKHTSLIYNSRLKVDSNGSLNLLLLQIAIMTI